MIVCGVCINEELSAVFGAIGVVALGVDAPVTAVLVVGLPGDEEAAASEGGDAGLFLVV